MSMSDILCVTNSKLCRGDFLERIGQIAACRPAGIILREKEMPPDDYEALAGRAIAICESFNVKLILHTHIGAAINLQAESIHLPLPYLREMTALQKSHFKTIGASCHSTADALEARMLGCTYITAGHIYETDCKKGLPGRGLQFLGEICAAVDIPVYGIGGINASNAAQVRRTGAGICLMSSLMQTEDIPGLFAGCDPALVHRVR